jgi:hypothetical protein
MSPAAELGKTIIGLLRSLHGNAVPQDTAATSHAHSAPRLIAPVPKRYQTIAPKDPVTQPQPAAKALNQIPAQSMPPTSGPRVEGTPENAGYHQPGLTLHHHIGATGEESATNFQHIDPATHYANTPAMHPHDSDWNWAQLARSAPSEMYSAYTPTPNLPWPSTYFNNNRNPVAEYGTS